MNRKQKEQTTNNLQALGGKAKGMEKKVMNEKLYDRNFKKL